MMDGMYACLKKEILKMSHADQLRLYPDPTSHELNAAIADFYHVQESQVFTGVGSDDVSDLFPV